MVKRGAAALLVAVLALVACGGADSSASATSDGDTWTLTLTSTELGTGWSDIELGVTSSLDGSPAVGLDLVADVAMPTMGHGSSEPVTSLELGGGDYVVSAFFEMTGAWQLSGTLADDQYAESFVVDLDVVADQ